MLLVAGAALGNAFVVQGIVFTCCLVESMKWLCSDIWTLITLVPGEWSRIFQVFQLNSVFYTKVKNALNHEVPQTM